MRISVIRPSELTAPQLATWHALQRDVPSLANPFLAPEFTVAVGRLRRDARVALLQESHGVVGFLPFERHALGVGKPIGAGLSDCQALVHEQGLDWDPRAVVGGCGLVVWEFDHLLATQAPFGPHHVVRKPSPVIDLSAGYDAYIAERRRNSTKLVKSTLSKARRLGREVGEVRFEFHDPDPLALRTLMRWKSAQYRRTGRADRFARPWIVQLVTDLAGTQTGEFAGVVSMLYAGEVPVAGHVMLRTRSTMAAWFPAYDTAFAHYSPGLILRLRVAEAAAAAGISQIDLGKGAFDYKERLKSRDLFVAEGWVETPSAGALLRRARRAPARLARDLVLDHPPLRRAADRTLRLLGGVRTSLTTPVAASLATGPALTSPAGSRPRSSQDAAGSGPRSPSRTARG